MLPQGGGGKGKDCTCLGRAVAKTALPQGGGGRGKDCTPSRRGGQGERLCSLGEGMAGAKTVLPREGGGSGKDHATSGKGMAGAKTTLPQGGGDRAKIALLRGGGGRGKDCTPSGKSGRIYWWPQLFDVTPGGHFFQRFMVTYQLTVIILLLLKKTRNLRLNILIFCLSRDECYNYTFLKGPIAAR